MEKETNSPVGVTFPFTELGKQFYSHLNSG